MATKETKRERFVFCLAEARTNKIIDTTKLLGAVPVLRTMNIPRNVVKYF